MSRYARRCIPRSIALIICAVCIGAVWSWISWQHDLEAVYFAEALRDAHINEQVTVGRVAYSVHDGAVFHNGTKLPARKASAALKLAYEKTVARRSPLIALPGSDPERVLDATAELRQTAFLLGQKQALGRDRALVQSSLYPFDFLEAAARTERARRTFLESGSDLDALAYEYAQRAAVRAYLRDISRFRSAFTIAAAQEVGTYVTATHIVDRAHIRTALDTLQNGMVETNELLTMRHACFRGAISDCDSTDIRLPVLDLPTIRPAAASSTLLAARIRDLLADRVGYVIAPDVSPLVQLSSSDCIVPRPGTDLLFTYQWDSGVGSTFFTPLYVGDISFIRSSDFSKTPFYAYFAERDIRYVPAGPLSYYNCPSSQRDIGTLLAIEKIREFALTDPLSTYASGKGRQTLVRFEQAAQSGSLITDRDALEYLVEGASLVRSSTLPHNERNMVISLLLEYQDGSGALINSINAINASERENIYLTHMGIPYSFAPAYLFFARSAFTSLFMADNPSVSGYHEELFKATDDSVSLPYVYFSELTRAGITEDDLAKDLMSYHALHQIIWP